jgi:hypothetical protein
MLQEEVRFDDVYWNNVADRDWGWAGSGDRAMTLQVPYKAGNLTGFSRTVLQTVSQSVT